MTIMNVMVDNDVVSVSGTVIFHQLIYRMYKEAVYKFANFVLQYIVYC